MELKFWIYVIIGVVYLLTRLKKKSDEKPPAVPEIPKPGQRVEMPTGHANKPKPLTFEELLREITEAKTTKAQPLPAEPAYVDYDDEVRDEIQDLEEIPASYKKKDAIYEMYEEGKVKAFARPSLEETLKLEDTDIRFGKFKGFELVEEENVMQRYTRDFEDPEGLKKAFVMSEILNRKF